MNRKLQQFLKIITWLTEFIIFVDFWIVIVICINGKFSYRLIKIFNTYLEASNIIRPLIIMAIAGVIWRLLKYLFPQRSIINIFQNPYYYFITALITYAAITIPSILQPYYCFSMGNAHDFALHHNAIFNTTQGNFLKTIIFSRYEPFTNWNLLKDHYYFILVLIAPIYSIFKNAIFILILQSCAITLSAIPIFMIAYEKLKDKWFSLLIACSYLLYPLVLRIPFFESRPEYYAIPLLLFAFYAIEKNRLKTFLVLVFFAVLCKEEVFLATIMFGLYIMFFKRKLEHHFLYGLCITVISAALLYFLLEIAPQTFNFDNVCSGFNVIGGKEVILSRVLSAGEWQKLLTSGKTVYFTNLFRHLGFIPLFHPIILLALPYFIENVMADNIFVLNHIWHSALIIPFIFIALISTIHIIIKFLPKMKFLLALWLTVFTLFFGWTTFLRNMADPFFDRKLYLDARSNRYKEFCQLASLIPQDASLSTNFNLLPHFSNREEIFWIESIRDLNKANTDYIFYSGIALEQDPDKKDSGTMEQKSILSKYTRIAVSDNFTVLARKEITKEDLFLVTDFNNDRDFRLWELNPCHTEYKTSQKNGSRTISIFFDGDGQEDEFIQMKITDININLEQFPYFFLEYNLDNLKIQYIEAVLGLDLDNDAKLDTYVKQIYPESSITKDRLLLNLGKLVANKYPHHDFYIVKELELYLHKHYEVNCIEDLKGWYNFQLRDIGFINRYVDQKDN